MSHGCRRNWGFGDGRFLSTTRCRKNTDPSITQIERGGDSSEPTRLPKGRATCWSITDAPSRKAKEQKGTASWSAAKWIQWPYFVDIKAVPRVSWTGLSVYDVLFSIWLHLHDIDWLFKPRHFFLYGGSTKKDRKSHGLYPTLNVHRAYLMIF